MEQRYVRLVVNMTVMAMLLTVLFAGHVASAAQQANSLDVSDQPIDNGAITVKNVVAEQAGWVAVFLDKGGNPGDLIGQAAIKQGANANVRVTLNQNVSENGKIWVRLHRDAGTSGTFEFPGADGPVQGTGLSKQITISQAPISLPNTGGSSGVAFVSLIAFTLIFIGLMLVPPTTRIIRPS